MSMDKSTRWVLVCGATGYVGGRLVGRLLDAGYRVRCLARDPGKLQDMPFRDHPALEIVRGDLADRESIAQALKGVDVAYYLVHSMIAAGDEYTNRDRQLAENFSAEVSGSDCRRVIYLGGLGELGADLSRHLRSRREVENILRDGSAKVTVLRAAMIIGSGSASFEILRYLTHRLPVMITPKWVATQTQPIAIRDVLRYLMECLENPETEGKTIDIGGPDVVSHRQMFQIMAERLNLSKRIIIPVPVLTPKLSSLWIGLVTPVSPRIARPLAEGLRNRTVCRNDDAQRLMPGPLFSVREAIDAALGKMSSVETRWASAGEMPTDPDWSGGTVYVDERSVTVNSDADTAFETVCFIGGAHGYWGVDWMWKIRGGIDQLVGGPGLRRGRRHPTQLRYGDASIFGGSHLWVIIFSDCGQR